MKKLLMVAALSAAGLAGTGAQAATTSGSFDVDITLNAVCTLSAITNVNFVYLSGGPLVNSTGGDFTITCTPGVNYSFAIEQPLGTGVAFPVLDNSGINLSYSLTTPAAGVGSGAAQALAISGSMAAAQPGNCGAASCNNGAATNNTYQLVVTY